LLLDKSGNITEVNYTRWLEASINNLYINSQHLDITALGAYGISQSIRINFVPAYDDFNHIWRYYLQLLILIGIALFFSVGMLIILDRQEASGPHGSLKKNSIGGMELEGSSKDITVGKEFDTSSREILYGETFSKLDPNNLSLENERAKRQKDMSSFMKKGDLTNEIIYENIELENMDDSEFLGEDGIGIVKGIEGSKN
jgi:hypothetical protein